MRKVPQISQGRDRKEGAPPGAANPRNSEGSGSSELRAGLRGRQVLERSEKWPSRGSQSRKEEFAERYRATPSSTAEKPGSWDQNEGWTGLGARTITSATKGD